MKYTVAFIFCLRFLSSSFAQNDTNDTLSEWKNRIVFQSYKVYKRVNTIDTSLLNTMSVRLDSELRFANPGEEWDNSCTRSKPQLPRKQLIWLAKSDRYVILAHLYGGYSTRAIVYFYDIENTSSNIYYDTFHPDFEKISFNKFQRNLKKGLVAIEDFKI